MIGGLAGKELRELRPWAVLGVVFAGIELSDALTRPIDRLPLGVTFGEFTDGMKLMWFLAFSIGTTLCTREEDDGTLAFLDGLPLTRSRVFFVKLGVATTVLLVFPVLKLLLAVGLHLLSRGSLDHAIHPMLLVQLFSMELLLAFAGLSFGAALGQLRSLTWMVAGGLAVGLGLLIKEVPRAAVLDPLSVAEVETQGLRLHLDPELVAVQTSLALLFAVIAWVSFVRAGGPRLLDLSKRPVVSALVSLLTVSAVIGAIANRAGDDESSERKNGSGAPRFAKSPPASTTTRYYRFSYPALQAGEALALAESSDAIFEEVHRLLQVPRGAMIDVDASGSMRTTSGTAFLGGLRMELGPNARAVLAHETAHVVSRRVAGEERAFLWNRANVLNEGLATWVERRFDAVDDAREERRLALAALHARRELLLEELVNPELLSLHRDDLLKYTAGEAIIDAIVRVYGVEALPRLLAAFGNEKLPPDLQGLALWQACFQLAQMDLGRVVDSFFGELDDAARELEDRVNALPRPRVVLLSAEGWYGARAVVGRALPEGWSLSLRFRPSPDSAFSTYDTFTVKPGEPAWREASRIQGGRLCVQGGTRMRSGHVLYEPWQCLSVRDAVPWTEETTEAASEEQEPGD